MGKRCFSADSSTKITYLVIGDGYGMNTWEYLLITINQPINQSIESSINQSISYQFTHQLHQSTHRSQNQAIIQHKMNQTMIQSIDILTQVVIQSV